MMLWEGCEMLLPPSPGGGDANHSLRRPPREQHSAHETQEGAKEGRTRVR